MPPEASNLDSLKPYRFGFLFSFFNSTNWMVVVEITKTGPLEKLVWAPIQDPDNKISLEASKALPSIKRFV
jgi:hypothetical protein